MGGGGCTGQRLILLWLEMLAGALPELVNYHALLPGIEFKICDILVVPAEKVFQEDQGFLKVVCVALSSTELLNGILSRVVL